MKPYDNLVVSQQLQSVCQVVFTWRLGANPALAALVEPGPSTPKIYS